ncbi:SUMF1/EgtB/PvdO family nonheme iron enzyme [Planktothrix agardhii]|uniref:SUMF1/EgtB/PvdO family nonheme iron enzyme n=1 Tax=Planktothrix agardhii TaxID=1160 RepID=UPI0034613F2A
MVRPPRPRRYLAFAPTDICFTRLDEGVEKGQASQCLRGGSWINNPDNCRSANRDRNTPDNFNNNNGFRVCWVVGASLVSVQDSGVSELADGNS